MKWIKPAGVSKYHLHNGEEFVCGKFFALDGREIEKIFPDDSDKCEACKNK